jgi:hypothetical protein
MWMAPSHRQAGDPDGIKGEKGESNLAQVFSLLFGHHDMNSSVLPHCPYQDGLKPLKPKAKINLFLL